VGKKRPERTARRAAERAARGLVRDREKLAAMTPGGAKERPIAVESSSVIEVRAAATPCPQCEGELRVGEHRAEAGLRAVDVRCTRCHAARTLWFRIVEPN
jgi:hypothetical protein